MPTRFRATGRAPCLAGQHAVEAEHGDKAPRLRVAQNRLLPIEPAHANHQPLLPGTPNDIASLDARVLHMGRDDRKIVGIKRDQFELGRHLGPSKFVWRVCYRKTTTHPQLRQGRLCGIGALVADPRDARTAGFQLILQPLEAPIEMVDAIDHGFALGGKTRNHQ